MIRLIQSHGAARARTRPASDLLQAARTAIGVWRQRRSLARLDAALLDDVGLTRSEADLEARRPIWDVPANWRA